jgi:protein TonB
MMEGSLIRRVQPVYPVPAKIAHVQGPVVLAAVISKAGGIENLHVLSGHPLLVPAAIDAVKQWRYRPYILNNEPLEVETQITVNFILGN